MSRSNYEYKRVYKKGQNQKLSSVRFVPSQEKIPKELIECIAAENVAQEAKSIHL